VRAAQELGAEAIVVYSTSGNTARLVSDYRPKVPIIALVPSAIEQRRLAFAWGVISEVVEAPANGEELLATIDARLEGRGLARPGDTAVVLFKQPLQSSQRTNTLLLHVVGAGRSRPPA
jgi:pyruvate kinase